MKQRKGWRMSCDVAKATEGLENELWRRWSDRKVREWAELIVIVIAELILQHFRHFTYVTTHSPTLPSLYLRHSSFSNPSVASPTWQFILQPFFRFSYVTSSSLNSPGEPPMPLYHSMLNVKMAFHILGEPPGLRFLITLTVTYSYVTTLPHAEDSFRAFAVIIA